MIVRNHLIRVWRHRDYEFEDGTAATDRPRRQYELGHAWAGRSFRVGPVSVFIGTPEVTELREDAQ